MTIKDLVVQIDQTPAAQVRLDAALVLAEHYEAHLTALFLIAEPFVRDVSGYHLLAAADIPDRPELWKTSIYESG
jgi:hypothetical protein